MSLDKYGEMQQQQQQVNEGRRPLGITQGNLPTGTVPSLTPASPVVSVSDISGTPNLDG